MKHLLCLLALCLVSCVASEELMIGQGNAFGGALEQVPNNPAVVAALSGNKVYRYRQFLLGGDHIIKTSNGSEYNHALTASFKDFLQTVGVAVVGWSQASVAKAKEVSARYEAGQITKRQAQEQMAAIQQAELAAKSGAVGTAKEAGAEFQPVQVNAP